MNTLHKVTAVGIDQRVHKNFSVCVKQYVSLRLVYFGYITSRWHGSSEVLSMASAVAAVTIFAISVIWHAH